VSEGARVGDFDEARLVAGIDLLGRTGAKQTQVRYSDDEEPVVWIATALYDVVPIDQPEADPVEQWEAAGALNPISAVLRLCEKIVDGGTCTHCGRSTGVALGLDSMPLPAFVCWYQFDPELRTFRRSCEGDTPNRAERRRRQR
jgi:hypothetical protein